jgi:hypothetical protein
MNGIGRILDQAVADLSSHPEDTHSMHRPTTATLEEDLRYRVHGDEGQVLVTDRPAAVGGRGIAPTSGWLLRATKASREATLIAVRAWVTAGHLGPHRDTSIGRHTGARC